MEQGGEGAFLIPAHWKLKHRAQKFKARMGDQKDFEPRRRGEQGGGEGGGKKVREEGKDEGKEKMTITPNSLGRS